jgi:ADP-ribose pyrophosphatase YjhB (NUDIX family)
VTELLRDKLGLKIAAAILDQLAHLGDPGRLVRKTYPGGHVFYRRDASRAALRQDAEAFGFAVCSSLT